MSRADGKLSEESTQFVFQQTANATIGSWIADNLETLSGADRLAYSAINGVPTAVSQFTNDSGFLISTDLAPYVTNSSLTTTLSGYVTNSSLTTTLGDYVTNSSLTTTLGSYVTNSSLTTTLGNYLLTSNFTWTNITGKPSTFTPSAHASTHAAAGSDPLTLAQSQITNLTSDLAAKQGTITFTTTGSGPATFAANALNIPTPPTEYTYVSATGTTVTLDGTNCGPANMIRASNVAAITATFTPGQPTGRFWLIEQIGVGVLTVASPTGGSRNGTRFNTAGQWTMMMVHHVGSNVLGFEGGVA